MPKACPTRAQSEPGAWVKPGSVGFLSSLNLAGCGRSLCGRRVGSCGQKLVLNRAGPLPAHRASSVCKPAESCFLSQQRKPANQYNMLLSFCANSICCSVSSCGISLLAAAMDAGAVSRAWSCGTLLVINHVDLASATLDEEAMLQELQDPGPWGNVGM